MRPDSTVLISETGNPVLEDSLSRCHAPVLCYTTVEALMGDRPLDSVDVLILHTRSALRGVHLVKLAQIALDHPGIQKIALMEGVPSLPLAKHLTACGFQIFHEEDQRGAVDLSHLVDEMQDRSGWMARVVGS